MEKALLYTVYMEKMTEERIVLLVVMYCLMTESCRRERGGEGGGEGGGERELSY